METPAPTPQETVQAPTTKTKPEKTPEQREAQRRAQREFHHRNQPSAEYRAMKYAAHQRWAKANWQHVLDKKKESYQRKKVAAAAARLSQLELISQ
jgi:hypothetical protein